ncbi:MAG: molecular chaperone TorD family protein [Nitrincola lacisaponensis]|uniref:molecular chaperone TorD family protein n=1 Tax=Nitrincola lacisaponensis TaxID=267850 RepID=UPI00391D499A
MANQTQNFCVNLLARAELYLCLAKAFSVADLPQTSGSLKSDLLPDLQSLATELPALSADWLKQFEQALSSVDHSELMMTDYGRLFLMPPAPAPLNLGFYLDAGVMGRCCEALESYYHQYALEKSPEFHDLSDHLSLTLQWFAWIFAGLLETPDNSRVVLKDAAEVISNFVLPAVQQLSDKADAFAQGNSVNATWLLLLHLVKQQLQDDLRQLADYLPEQSTPFDRAHKNASECLSDQLVPVMQLTCSLCECEFIADEVLGGMVSRLEEAGVDANHIKVCSVCKDVTVEHSRMTPPGAKRFKQRV